MSTTTDADRGLAASTLWAAIVRSGTTPAALARAAGVSRALVHDYLSGAKQPSVAQLSRLLRAVGLEPVVELVETYRPLTLRALADLLAQESREPRRWRLLQEFLRGHGEAVQAVRAALVADEPAPVDPRWDALLGGLAEHLAFHGGRAVPLWALRGERFLDRWWFPGAVDAEGRTERMVTAPAALAARGVWLEREALERAGVERAGAERAGTGRAA